MNIYIIAKSIANCQSLTILWPFCYDQRALLLELLDGVLL